MGVYAAREESASETESNRPPLTREPNGVHMGERTGAVEAMVVAVKELLREHGVDQITVIQIAQRANISRKTFYSHFCDKYDLINWICYKEWVDNGLDDLLIHGWSAVDAALSLFERDRAFYSAALADTGQNSFGSFFVNMFTIIIETYAEDIFAKYGQPSKYVHDMACLLSDDFRLSTIAWLTDEPDVSKREFVERIFKMTEAFAAFVDIFDPQTAPQLYGVKKGVLTERLADLRKDADYSDVNRQRLRFPVAYPPI